MPQLKIAFRLRLRLRLMIAASVGAGALALAFVAPGQASAAAAQPEYIVQMEAGSSPQSGMRTAEKLGGRVTSEALPVINGFGVSLSARDAARLESRADVRAVSPNGDAGTRADMPIHTSGGYSCEASDATSTPAPFVPVASRWQALRQGFLWRIVNRSRQVFHRAIGAGPAWRLGVNGRGVGVAVIDTGINGDLADFRVAPDNPASRVIASAVTNPCATDAKDHYGHGTHVAGLIAGNSNTYPMSNPNYAAYLGVAPRANLISVKASDDDGRASVLDVIHGLQFVVDTQSTYNTRVVNLSLSSSVAESYKTDPLDAAVEHAWMRGIVVVAAAGNDGGAPDAVSYAPGNDPYIITAGAVDDRGTTQTEDDKLASWSSRGKTQDGVKKPEVLAPGTGLVSTLAPNSDFVELCPTCVVDGGYFRLGGTSMSSALVAGVAALVVDARPWLTPNQVKAAITDTMTSVPGTGSEVHAYNAVLYGRGSANEDLAPSTLILNSAGDIDWARASFRRASFRDAAGSPLEAEWSRASFRCDCSLLPNGTVDPARGSFRSAGFTRTTDFER